MNDSRTDFDHQLSGIAWSLWRELGVAGIDHFHENCLIQPEELIILTMIIAEYDPRLRDEALDWCSRYHELISVSRLRTLLKAADPHTVYCFSQFVAVLNSVSSAKWPNAAETALFNVKLSGKSSLPPLERSSLLMLRLRSLFGPGAKADVMACLLTQSERHVSAADLIEIGYSKRTLMTTLDHLAASGVVAITNLRNKKNYELNRPRELQVVIGKLPKIAPPWNKILQVITAIRSVIPELQNSSETTQSVILRNCLIGIESLLPVFISPILYNKPDFKRDWKAIMEILNAFRQGNFFNYFEVSNEFDTLVIDLLRELYQVDDCLNGIEQIQDTIAFEPNQHVKKYKECYQLFLSFIKSLEDRLEQFLKFPFHKMMDESLAEIPYQFSKEKLPQFLEKIKKIKPIDQITHFQLAIQQYQLFMPEIHGLEQVIYTFRKRLKDLYFVRTDIHLLPLPESSPKRQLVLDLFPVEAKN